MGNVLLNSKNKAIYPMVLIGLFVALIVSLVLALGFGSTSIPASDVYSVLLHELFGIGDAQTLGSGNIYDVVMFIRLPRLVLAVAVGIALSVGGAVTQAVVKNPIADPYILGISSGGYLGATLALALGIGGALFGSAMGVMAFVGSFVVSVGVMMVSNVGAKAGAVKLILTGVAFSAVCSAVANFAILMLNDASAVAVVHWSMGGLGGADSASNAIIMGVAVIGTVFFTTQSRTLNLMLLGDETAVTLGVNLQRNRIIYMLVCSVMVGFTVYKAGMIGFVGLIVPHVIRMIFGTDYSKLIPLCALVGSIFMVWADVLCRVILPGNEIPVGIITAMVGAPIFIYLIIVKKYGFGGTK